MEDRVVVHLAPALVVACIPTIHASLAPPSLETRVEGQSVRLFGAAEPTDDYEVASRRLPGRVTSRADLADALVREAVEPQHSRSIIEVMTRPGTPSLMTFLKEAFGNRG